MMQHKFAALPFTNQNFQPVSVGNHFVSASCVICCFFVCVLKGNVIEFRVNEKRDNKQCLLDTPAG